MHVYLARTILGARGVLKECAKQFRLHSRTSCARSRQEEEEAVIYRPVNNSRQQNVLALILHGHTFRNVHEECAKRIPTALALLSFSGVLPCLLFFHQIHHEISGCTANDGGLEPRCICRDNFTHCVNNKKQDQRMCKISVSSHHHHALDQRSWDSKVKRRSHDIAIDYRAKRFSRPRYAWYDICVCIEKASHACAFPIKSKGRRATCSERRPILTRTWSMSIFWPPELMKLHKVYQIYSIYAERMTTFGISTQDGTKHC